MFKVEAYEDIRECYKKLASHDAAAMHLAADREQERLIKSSFNNDNANVTNYSRLIRSLFPVWAEKKMDLYLQSELKKSVYNHTEDHPKLRKQLVNQLQELMITLRFLSDLPGLFLNQKHDETQERKVIRLVMNEMLVKDEIKTYQDERLLISESRLKEAFHIKGFLSEPVIYVYMHTFIDAPRLVLYYLLESAGYSIIFRIPYQGTRPQLHRGWLSVYEAILRPGGQHIHQVQYGVPKSGTSFANKIEGINNLSTKSDEVYIKRYEHPQSLKRDLDFSRTSSNQAEFAAPDAEYLNGLFVDDTNTAFFASKSGQFFDRLRYFQMYNGDYMVDYDSFCDCILSGWCGEAGLRALPLLLDIESYMSGIASVREIKERLLRLIELQEVSQAFEDEGKEQTGRSRVKRYLSNPFRVFPIAHQQRYPFRGRQLYDLTVTLEKLLQSLFVSDVHFEDVNDYFQKVRDVIEIYNPAITEDERQTLLSVCLRPIEESWTFSYDDLVSLMALRYSSSKRKQFRKMPDSEVNVYVKSLRASLAVPFICPDLHLTGLSKNSFPQPNLDLPVYLDYSWLKESIKSSNLKQEKTYLHALLVDYKSREEGQSFDVYALYAALAFKKGKVTFSWIENVTDFDSPSLYYTFLNDLYAVSDQDGIKKSIEQDLDWPDPDLIQKPTKEFIKEQLPQFPSVYWLDEDTCSRKMMFNAVMDNQPVYESDFHQRIAFAMIGSLFKQQGEGIKKMQTYIYPLFPQWTPTLKDNLIQTAYASPFRNNHDRFENVQFPMAMSRIQLLFSKSKRRKLKKKYNANTLTQKDGIDSWYERMDKYMVQSEPGHHCRMCPHLYRCDEGRFAVDGDNK